MCEWARWQAWGLSDTQGLFPGAGGGRVFPVMSRQSPFTEQGIVLLRSFAQAAVTEYHLTEWLEQLKCIFSPF